MDSILFFSLAGAVVGLLIGITGVGGGSLMTPILLMLGIPAHTAIGTDLLYASITKASGIAAHQKQKNIDWSIVIRMASGSIPAALVTTYILSKIDNFDQYTHILTTALGAMLIVSAFSLIFRTRLLKFSTHNPHFQKHSSTYTILMGAIIGALVTLSSVGAGVVGTAVLMLLYPLLASRKIVGTDLAHAVPLTMIAGLGHLGLGNVDFHLLGGLLLGSIPATIIGSMLSAKIPNNILRYLLVIILLIFGIKYLVS